MKKLLAALTVLLLPALAAAQSPQNVFGIDFTANNSLAVSAANHARLRYNSGTGVLEMSLNGAAYATVGGVQTLASTYAAGTGTASSIMTLDSTRGPVIVKDSSPSSGSPLFAVQNNGAASFFSITPSSQQFIRGGSADGAAAVGLAVDTFNSFANATSKILRVLTGGSERFSVTGPGNINVFTNGTIQSLAQGATNTVGMTIKPDVADGASSVALLINTGTTLANASASLLKIQNNGTTRLTTLLNSTDGVSLQDGGGSSKISLSTNGASTALFFGAGNLAVTSTSINITPNNGIANVNAELQPNSSFGAGLTLGDSSTFWTGSYLGFTTVKAKASTTTSIASYSDSSGNARYGVDVEGLPSLGSRYEQRILFDCAGVWAGTINLVANTATATTPAGCAPNWIYTSSANATGTVLTGGFASNSPVNGLQVGTGTSNGNAMLIRAAPVALPNNLSNMEIVFEEPVNISVAGSGTNITFRVGLTNAGLSTPHPGGYYFEKTSTSANWFCVTDDGAAGTPVDTTVAATTNAQMLRIEYYGSGTTIGNGTKTAKFYIDGSLVCTRTANVYSSGAVAWQAWATVTTAGPITQQSLATGPVLVMFNEVASALIP